MYVQMAKVSASRHSSLYVVFFGRIRFITGSTGATGSSHILATMATKDEYGHIRYAPDEMAH